MFGLGLLKGLGVTMRHFVDSYLYDRKLLQYFTEDRYDKDRLAQRQAVNGKGLFTIQYPEQKRKISENFRFIPMLIYEETAEDPRCTACGICARVCPPQCIWIERATDAKGRPQAKPAGFWVDAVICMSCGYCAEYCPFDAIKMNQMHEIATPDRDRDLFYDLGKLLVPVEYYAEIHPSDYAREEKARQVKEEAKRQAAEKKKAAAAAKKAAAAKAAAEAKATSTEAADTPAAPSEPDDLTRIEGVGPKISGVLQAAGITTFAQLADTEVDRIKEILEASDPKLLRLADPSTWPRQAKLAAAGKWEPLAKWQERLKGGQSSG
jgi:NADH-quinone oxidoreductase subunit I